MTLIQYITNLLDEYTAQTNKGTSSAALLTIYKNTASNPNPDKSKRVDIRVQLKCTYYSKIRYIEAECYTKYPEKKAAFEKMLVEKKAKKALKKQQALLKETPKLYVANTTTTPSLLLSVQYDFTTSARLLIATTHLSQITPKPVGLLLSNKYTFGEIVYVYIVGDNSN